MTPKDYFLTGRRPELCPESEKKNLKKDLHKRKGTNNAELDWRRKMCYMQDKIVTKMKGRRSPHIRSRDKVSRQLIFE
jgi:hypothetical protein